MSLSLDSLNHDILIYIFTALSIPEILLLRQVSMSISCRVFRGPRPFSPSHSIGIPTILSSIRATRRLEDCLHERYPKKWYPIPNTFLNIALCQGSRTTDTARLQARSQLEIPHASASSRHNYPHQIHGYRRD
jgi:hypothetical protein